MSKDNITLSNSEKKERAYKLFSTGVTQKEICKIVGVSNVTLKKWKDNGCWSKKRVVKEISVDNLIDKILLKADAELDKDSFNADTFSKIISQLKSLKSGNTSVIDRMTVFMDFGEWVMAQLQDSNKGNILIPDSDHAVDINFYQIVVLLQDLYIKTSKD